MFVAEHLKTFVGCFPVPPVFATAEEQEGKSPADWFKDVDRVRLGGRVGVLPSAATNRTTLLTMAADRTIGTLDLCISILAWGGMHGGNRNRLFKCPLEPWLDIAEQVRNGKLDRLEAYSAFARLRDVKADTFVGMGPAYFTKLLYFLAPSSTTVPKKGYIMDQWVSCSINLLTGQQIVKLDQHLTWKLRYGAPEQSADSYVSDVNTAQDYERFCQAVEALSDQMGPPWTPELTERALISNGGKTPRPWRAYIKKRRLESGIVDR
jgi:hypothetical protein